MADKPLRWLGASRSDVRAFPRDARRLAGFQLRRVQLGLDPFDWKPMSSVGPGVREIRVRTALEHRVLYGFEKRTGKTPQRDLELARQRFRDLAVWRKGDKPTGR